jgi:hypothetical protein
MARFAIVLNGTVTAIVDAATQDLALGRIGPCSNLVDVGWRYAGAQDTFLPPETYRDRRATAYKAELAKVAADAGRFEPVVGDVLDILITQVEAMRAAAGAAKTAEFDALLVKIAAIKAANPKM